MVKFSFDVNDKTIDAPKHWQFCVGSGHAYLTTRADYQEQLKYVKDELGFERVRFHGIFNDDMNVVQTLAEAIPFLPNAKKVRTYNFYQVGVVYDALLKIGIKPFVELSFMPSALASGKKTVFHYKGNITPPRDYIEWENFIKSFINFLIDRYGKEEVLTWYFEVWNEPDLSIFWTGKQKGYFKLYYHTTKAIKSIDERFIVGGPSTSGNRWVSELKNYCNENNLPLDFLSTHHYPGDACGHSINFKTVLDIIFNKQKRKGKSVNEALREILFSEKTLYEMEKGILTKQAKKAKEEAGEIPLFYTEWNVNSTCTAPIHDTRASAAFCLKTLIDNQGIVDGSSFWCFSDIFEELFFFPEPFSGSFGMLNIYGIPKPSFWAFKFLNAISDKKYEIPVTNDDVEFSAFKGSDVIHILLYAQKYYQDNSNYPVSFDLTNITDIKNVTIESIDEQSGNPLKVWKEMGEPVNLNKDQVEHIKKESKVIPCLLDYKTENNTLSFSLDISTNDVKLITINLA